MSQMLKSKLSTSQFVQPQFNNESKVGLLDALNKIKIEKKKVYEDLLSSRIHDEKSYFNYEGSHEKCLTLRNDTYGDYEDDEKSVQLLFTEQKERIENTFDTPVKQDFEKNSAHEEIPQLNLEQNNLNNSGYKVSDEHTNLLDHNQSECVNIDILNTAESKGKMSFHEISEEIKKEIYNPMASFDEGSLKDKQIIELVKPADDTNKKFETASYGSDVSDDGREDNQENINQNIQNVAAFTVSVSNSLEKSNSVNFKSKAMQNVYQSHHSSKH